MNRAERSRIEKQQQRIGVQKAKEEAVDTVMILLMSLPVKVLHERFNWGEKRLGRFCDALTDAYQEFSDGELELEGLQQLVWEECGIKFQRTKDK